MSDPSDDFPSPGTGGTAARDATDRQLEQSRRDWRLNWQERRAQQRYPLGTPYQCNLELDNGMFPPMPVQLVDISLGGACLLISSLVDLRRGEMGELRHHNGGSPDHAGMERLRLRICWQEVRDWITAVGVAFEPPLDSLPPQLDLA